MGVNVITTATELVKVTVPTPLVRVIVPGPQGPVGAQFLIDPTPAQEAAAPNGTVILITT